MHRLTFPDTDTCYLFGWLFGNVGFGVNADFWRKEHDSHHAAPNSWDKETGIYDEQIKEYIFVHDELLFPFHQLPEQALFIRHQWWTVFVLPMLFSKSSICIRSYLRYGKLERGPFELLGGALHILWVYQVLSRTDNPWLGLFIA